MTEGRLNHILHKHPEMTEEKVIAGLRSIKQIGESVKHKGQMVSLSQNNVLIAYRDNVVYTAFVPERKDYFKDVSEGRFKKWVERLRRMLAAGR
ncbi:hypothetical protein A45J_1865 [hot springs metagenome]|uniref:Uncharacterized protein n=1 Tax=hot springs metagenome TaxID=433727 RepID=A0A5J4L5N1_9ZZZZ